MSAEKKTVAVVTGASSGIGRATADLFRARGWTTIGLARSLRDGKRARQCDVSDEESVTRAFSSVLKEHGRVDVLVNSAGAAHVAAPLSVSVSNWRDVLGVNVIGTYLCCRAVLPSMKSRKRGRIVNVGSIAARSYSKTASVAYTASKYAVLGLTRQLAAAFARDGVAVNCVCPSQTRTEMLENAVPKAKQRELARSRPMGRLAEPEEVAAAIFYLASIDASYVNGAVLDVSGGPL